MISPMWLIVIYLASCFTYGVLGEKFEKFAVWKMSLTLFAVFLVSLYWSVSFIVSPQAALISETAGFAAPFSINFKVGKEEAFALLIINSIAFFGVAFVRRYISANGKYSAIAYLLNFFALNGIVMTRDIFNYFVFTEISSVAVAGMLIFRKSGKLFKAGFSWLVATGIISVFLTLSAVLIYKDTGVLDLDTIVVGGERIYNISTIALFMFFLSLMLELKPFPVNGWIIDVYESASPAIVAIISGSVLTAALFALYKFMPLLGDGMSLPVSMLGGCSFLFSNIMALKQRNVNRMLGYSSLAQAGLATLVIGLGDKVFGGGTFLIAGSLVAVHAISKTGLFWLSDEVGFKNVRDWITVKSSPETIFLLGIFVFSILSFPPFPTFFAKWLLIEGLVLSSNWIWLAVIFTGSVVEAAFFVRWFGYSVKMERNVECSGVDNMRKIPFYFAVFALLFISFLIPYMSGYRSVVMNAVIPFVLIALFFIMDFIPAKVKNFMLTAVLLFSFFYIFPLIGGVQRIFAVIFLVGGATVLITGFRCSGKRKGFYPAAAIMYCGLGGILVSSTAIEFLLWWEIMTLGSYLLLLRGEKALSHALSYMLFSMGGAFCILTGFNLILAGEGGIQSLAVISGDSFFHSLGFVFLTIGFLTKIAALPLHIWLPGAHSEAEIDVSPILSAIILKSGVFGLIMISEFMGNQNIAGFDIHYMLGWLGALTALSGNIMALQEHDAKRILACSSIAQLGYILFGLSMVSYTGMLASVAATLNHFAAKALLFIAVGGIVSRLKLRNIYSMGGLAGKMPVSFLSMVTGFIVLSGVPPFTSFGGKWLIEKGVSENGWILQGFIIKIAGVIALLVYLNMIYRIFFSKPKHKIEKVKEAPLWMIVPQLIFIATLLLFSVFPGFALIPLGNLMATRFPGEPLIWSRSFAGGTEGYWDGTVVTYILLAVIFLFYGWTKDRYKNKYIKTLKSIFSIPFIKGFWYYSAAGFNGISLMIIKLLSGNSQIFAIHILIFTIVCFLAFFR